VTKDIPINYFKMTGVSPSLPEELPRLPYGSHIYDMLGREAFLDRLAQECFVAIDDPEGYIGWSRFVMECALNYLPCIGSNYATKLIFPELYTEHKDYKKQKELILQLRSDKKFYNEIAERGCNYVLNNLSPEVLCRKFLDLAHSLNCTDTKITQYMLDKEALITILEKSLPFHVPPKKPPKGCTIYDNISREDLDEKRWEEIYGRFERFISDDMVYKAIITETIERKNQMRRSIL
jgi:hypothetical protein